MKIGCRFLPTGYSTVSCDYEQHPNLKTRCRVKVDSKTMHFKSRELKPYAEPLSSEQLRVGETYFALNYVDSEMLVPLIGTWVFIGKNLGPDDENVVYFQDIESYRKGVAFNGEAEHAIGTFFCGNANETNHIFNYEEL